MCYVKTAGLFFVIHCDGDSPLLLCLTQSWKTACHFFCSFSVITQK